MNDKLRKITRTTWTTCPRYRDPRKGVDVVVEKHERGFGEKRPAGIVNQNYWWTFTISGGVSDGAAYYSKADALSAARVLLRGSEATG